MILSQIYNRYKMLEQNSNSERSRSRDKADKSSIRKNSSSQSQQQAKLKNISSAKRNEKNFSQPTYSDYLQRQQQFHANQDLLRSFLRIQQGRQQPIDKFVKILYVYKGKMKIDHKLLQIIKQPKKYLNSLTVQQLKAMLPQAQIHRNAQIEAQSKFIDFWNSTIQLIGYKINKKNQSIKQVKPQFKSKVKQMLNKTIQQLQKIEQTIRLSLQNPSFNSDGNYWEAILLKIQGKKIEKKLISFYQKYKETHQQEVEKQDKKLMEDNLINTSPLLKPRNSLGVNEYLTEKLLTTDLEEKKYRQEIAEKIFKQEFQKGRQRLENNLSLPKNHNLLSSNIIEESTTTYDFISKEILEFEKYKRPEEDEEQFDDWVPCETQGRFRDRKPIYLNRVRVSYQWNKFNQNHFSDDNPPPKTIQGYKFNIFYPDLYDKQKTPQYYLENTQDPDYCIIKFKAGPPYKDVAFKMVKKEWDFSQKSGFESIFAKGILHLYFNFKKPKYRL